MKHRAKIEKGKPIFVNRDRFMKDLENHEGKDVYISITVPKSKRSDQQNRYYWGVVVKILSDELGYFSDEMHELLRIKFLKRELVLNEVIYTIGSSTTKLSTKEMEEYLEDIRRWAAIELNILIPLPNEIDYD